MTAASLAESRLISDIKSEVRYKLVELSRLGRAVALGSKLCEFRGADGQIISVTLGQNIDEMDEKTVREIHSVLCEARHKPVQPESLFAYRAKTAE